MKMQAVQVAWLFFVLGGVSATVSPSLKLCGRQLSEVMSRICTRFNSPSWEVEDQAHERFKRSYGIADECCNGGCTWAQLTEYCAVESDPSSENVFTHVIEDRSAEKESGRAAVAEQSIEDAAPEAGEGGAALFQRVWSHGELKRSMATRGYGRRRSMRKGRRRRRCHCRRRHAKRNPTHKGNMESLNGAVRFAPIIGTVSPRLSQGHTLHSEVPDSHVVYIAH